MRKTHRGRTVFKKIISGRVLDICDHIATVSGLDGVFCGERVTFISDRSDVTGFIWNIEDNICKVPLISGTQTALHVGDLVYRTCELVKTRCGFCVLGEVMNPLGIFLASSSLTNSYSSALLNDLFKTKWRAVEARAPGIIDRSPVTVPLLTGVASIDCFLPIGRGQRELIIGDHNTGKTSLAITAIINQGYINNDICEIWKAIDWSDYKYSLFLPCVYVAIGAKRSEIVRIRRVLIEKNAMHYTCIIFTSADDLAALQYLAPFAGCSVGEWFMYNGYDALVIYDELSQHAVAYRQMALLLRRPPGREAYPGDVFYLHARLLERAAQLAKGGSLTALPIVQTFGGDLSGYISTNVISITDGQIFLVKALVNKGIRPAIDLTLSVSRIGSAAQYTAMIYVSKRVKSVHALARTYTGVARLGTDDLDVLLHVHRGERLRNFLTQNIYETYSFYKQVFCLYALTLESMDVVLPSQVKLFFTLLSMRHFSYAFQADCHLVTYFLDTSLIEPLLLVFSFDIIEEDVVSLVDTFSTFFQYEIQNNDSVDLEYLIEELTRVSSNH